MNLMEKNMELNSLMNSFKEVLKSYDNNGFSVYVKLIISEIVMMLVMFLLQYT